MLSLTGLLLSQPGQASPAIATGLAHQIERCINDQFKKNDVVSRNATISLKSQCPGLISQLKHPALSQLEPQPNNKTSTLSQLLDIKASLAQLGYKLDPDLTLEHRGLHALLKDTHVATPELEIKPSLWQQFIDWLEAWLQANENEEPGWLIEFLQSFEAPDWFIEVAFKSVIVILIIFLIITVFNELRAASLLSAWKHTKNKRKTDNAVPLKSAPGNIQSWDDIKRLQGRQQISALLYYTLLRLMNRGLLPESFSYTNRELLDAFKNKNTPGTAPFSQLIHQSDAGLYGKLELSEQQRTELLNHARQLLESTEDKA